MHKIEVEAMLAPLRKRVERLETALTTALVWMAQSANSPLRHDEVRAILKGLEKDGPTARPRDGGEADG